MCIVSSSEVIAIQHLSLDAVIRDAEIADDPSKIEPSRPVTFLPELKRPERLV